jgi:hypothetical protein
MLSARWDENPATTCSGAGWHPNVTYFAGKVGFCVNCGADPLVRAGRPRPALASKNQAPAIIEEPARGPAADEGVRPTK